MVDHYPYIKLIFQAKPVIGDTILFPNEGKWLINDIEKDEEPDIEIGEVTLHSTDGYYRTKACDYEVE